MLTHSIWTLFKAFFFVSLLVTIHLPPTVELTVHRIPPLTVLAENQGSATRRFQQRKDIFLHSVCVRSVPSETFHPDLRCACSFLSQTLSLGADESFLQKINLLHCPIFVFTSFCRAVCKKQCFQHSMGFLDTKYWINQVPGSILLCRLLLNFVEHPGFKLNISNISAFQSPWYSAWRNLC